MSETSSMRSKIGGRSSIRHSLNFSSVGKAFSDAMHKDDKNAKRLQKDSHRSSAIFAPANDNAFRDAANVEQKASPPAKKIKTPDQKTITARRRMSTQMNAPRASLDGARPSAEGSIKPPSLRPRPATASGLPKYRPKSIILDNSKPSGSPLKTGTRKRLSTSDDEAEPKQDPSESDKARMQAEKATRPISPLPHRAAFRANLSNTVNTSASPKASSTPNKLSKHAPSSSNASPPRITKAAKDSVALAATRPPSSTSASSSSRGPRTPSTKRTGGTSEKARQSPASSSRMLQESPLFRQTKKAHLKTNSPPPKSSKNMSLISEGNTEDLDEENVKDLLAPVASLAEPTPAMPRMQKSRSRMVPQTPSRFKPPRVMPLPPDSDSPPSLRVKKSSSEAPRGSILSWEQLANESRSLDEDEIGHMISEMSIPAGMASPDRRSMLLSVPETPCLSTMNSPAGRFGSISQVLLPDVTPSPAVHHSRADRSGETTAVDGAIVTLLRLQLASAEEIAKERLTRLQVLEEEVYQLEQARTQEVSQLSNHISQLEAQIREIAEDREQAEASFTEQIEQLEAEKDEAVAAAVLDASSKVRGSWQAQKRDWQRACGAHGAFVHWANFCDSAQNELSALQNDQQVLQTLLTQLDFLEQQLPL